MILIFLSCVWVLGIFLGYKFHLPWVFCLFGLAPLLLIFLTRKHIKLIVLASLGIVLLVASTAYSYSSLNTVDESRLRFYNDLGSCEVRGKLVRDPDVRDKSTHLFLSVEFIKLDGTWREVSGTALVFVPRYPTYHYGDVLRLTGELNTPPVLGDFDYRGYLEHQGIHTTITYPEIEVADTGEGFPPLAWIYSLRENLAESLAQVLPEPHASLAQGIILGMRGNIPDDLNSAFARSGTTHLLAISGFNISIMAGILLGVGLWLFGRRHYLYIWLALGAVWLYAVLTGMNPPVLRSAFMASLFLIAEALGRQHSGMVALTFAAAVMAGIHPYILGDASFQLSFLAMAGLVSIYPVLNGYGSRMITARLGDGGFLASFAGLTVNTMSATLAAIIAVWPVVAYYFGIFSLAGPLATFLTTLVLPVIIILGTLAAVTGLLWLPAAQVVGWLAWLFLSYMMAVVRGLAAPPVAVVEVDSLSPVFIAGYYIVLAALILVHARWRRMRSLVSGAAGLMKAGAGFSFGRGIRWAVAPLSVLAILAAFTAASLPGDNLRVSFLDVGQGDAVLIQIGNQQILVDGGPSPRAISLGLGSRMPFWDRSIDLLVLTHPHQDHLAGLVEVLRRYNVGQALYPSLDYSSPLFDEWLRTIEEKRVEGVVAQAGQRVTLGEGLVMEVLSAQPAAGEDIDDASLVLRLEYGKVSFLITGDIGKEAERELVRERAGLSVTVLKVAHHGSDTSSSLEFLAVVNPTLAVISVGADNNFGLPDEEALTRLNDRLGEENVYRTDERGTIDFVTDGDRLWVETER